MIDLSGAYALEDLINGANSNDIKVFVLNGKSHIKKMLERINFVDNIGKGYYMDSKEAIISILLDNYSDKQGVS